LRYPIRQKERLVFSAVARLDAPTPATLMTTTTNSRAGRTTPQVIFGLIATLLAGAVAAYLLGKDLNWDFYNYHLYSPLAYWTQDLKSEFMGAGMQRYLNPLGYLPFYWMVAAGWHSAIIGMLLGAFHSLSVFFLWRICNGYLFKDGDRRRDWVALALAFGISSTVFLSTLGSTFLDPSACVLVMAGLYLMFAQLDAPAANSRQLLLAGLLFGLSTGLKPTGAIFFIAAALAYWMAKPMIRRRTLFIVPLAIGGAVGVLAAHGWWSYLLLREFGNPFFPFANEIFRSPDFPSVAFDHARFRPSGLVDAVLLPFQMVTFRSWIYVEPVAPDLRFATLVIVTACLLLKQLPRLAAKLRIGTAAVPLATQSSPNAPVRFALLFCCIAYVLWQVTSGNGRYALPLMLFAGPMLVLAVRHLFLAYQPSAIVGLAVLLLVHAFHAASAGNPRWSPAPWTKQWLEIDVAPELKSEPFGFITPDINSYSAIAFALHPDSRFLGLGGSFPIDPDGPGGSRAKRFLAEHRGRTRILLGTSIVRQRTAGRMPLVRLADERIAGWNLRVVPDDCLKITLPDHNLIDDAPLFLACAVTEGSPLRDRQNVERQMVARVFDRIERTCPMLFRPAGGYILFVNGRWVREYSSTDIRMFASSGRVRFTRFQYGPFEVDLGTVDEWLHGNPAKAPECRPLQRVF
jgi:hypothetical protein